MVSYNPPNDVAFFPKVGYAQVTSSISLHCPGQICFLGRYYSAELLKPRPIELKEGTYVLVYGERGFSLVVEKNESIHIDEESQREAA